MIRLCAIVGLSLALSGCWFRKKPVATPPPPIPAQDVPVQDVPVQEPAPRPPVSAPAPPPPVVEEKPVPVQKPSPSPEKKPAAGNPPQRAPVRPSPAPGAPAEPSAGVPQLGEILSPGTRKRYEAEYAVHVQRAQQSLARVADRQLTDAQKETANRVRTFLRQAAEQRGRDLATALKLALRADLLGQDLARGVP